MSSTSSKDLILKLETDKPNVQLQKKALIELRETPENIETGLKELKRILEADEDLLAPINNEEWLLIFLRTCKFYPESAKDLIKSYYNIRHKYPEVTGLLIPSKLKFIFDENLVSLLPQRDQHGRRIILTLSGSQWNQKTITQGDILAGGALCSAILQKEPKTQINGVVYLLDLGGLTFSQALHFTPHVLKRALDFVQDHEPLRMKGFHVVNQPKIFQPIFAAIKPFFNSKYSKRILLHGNNYESLHQHISPECLPKCYGGTLETPVMYCRETYEILAGYEEFFKNCQQFGYGKKKNSS